MLTVGGCQDLHWLAGQSHLQYVLVAAHVMVAMQQSEMMPGPICNFPLSKNAAVNLAPVEGPALASRPVTPAT